MNKINSKWDYGIFVGVRQKSGEFWVANESGIHKARSVRRIAVQDRWTQDSVKWVEYVPWNRYKDQQDADGDIPEEAADDELEEEMDEVHAGGWAWDDVKNKPLDVGKVREARLEEVGYMIRKGIWKEVDIQECWDRTGREPVRSSWLTRTRARTAMWRSGVAWLPGISAPRARRTEKIFSRRLHHWSSCE